MKNIKRVAERLTEVTAVIQGEDNINYHQTFLIDTAKHQSFIFMGVEYKIPFQEADYFSPGFWDWPLKWGMFYEQHKTLARFFDWFHFRDKAVHMVEFLYNMGNPDPIKIEPPSFDWALENYNLMQNTTVEEAYKDDDEKLKGKSSAPMGILALIGVVVVAIVIGVVLITVLSGQGDKGAQVIQNATLTPGPFNSGGFT